LGADLRDAIARVQEHRDMEERGADHDANCVALVNRIAAKLQRLEAGKEILATLASGKLQAYGIPEQGEPVHVLIRTEQFLTKKEIVFPEDMLVPGRSDSDEEERLARSAGRWKHVRFRRADFDRFLENLVETDRVPKQDPHKSSQRRAAGAPPPAKRTKAELSAEAYWELFPEGHQVNGLHWSQVEDMIHERVKKTVSKDTIKRGLRDYPR